MINLEQQRNLGGGTGALRAEHETILSMLDVIERIAALIQEGEKLEDWVLGDLFEFLKVFVDSSHHAKEETVLFPALEAKGIPREGGPIGVMLHEHQEGRGLIERMEETARAHESGAKAAAAGFSAAAIRYVELLRQHIHKENDILYVMAEACLTAEEEQELSAGYADIEEDRLGPLGHQCFRAKTDRLRVALIGR